VTWWRQMPEAMLGPMLGPMPCCRAVASRANPCWVSPCQYVNPYSWQCARVPRQGANSRVRRQVAIANDSDSNQLSQVNGFISARCLRRCPQRRQLRPGRERCGVEPGGDRSSRERDHLAGTTSMTQTRGGAVRGCDQPEAARPWRTAAQGVGANAKIVEASSGTPTRFPPTT